jgi:drug/metabolite transporter (DMT)-like permease
MLRREQFMGGAPMPSTEATTSSASGIRHPASGVRSSTRPDWLALTAGLISVMLWASAFVGIRAAGSELSPGSLAFGRLAIGTLALGLVVLVRHAPMPRGRDWFRICAAGVAWFGVYNVALNAGERLVDAGTASMLGSMSPILQVILAGVLLGEGFPPRLVVGTLIAFGGALLIGLATATGALGTDAEWGIALCLVAAVGAALGITLEKPALARASPLVVTFIACAVGALVTAPFAPGLADELASASPEAIGWWLYLGAFPTTVAFTTWAFALSRTKAGVLSSLVYLVPAMTIALGWLLLGEVPAMLAVIGGAIAIAGVVVSRSRSSEGPSGTAAIARELLRDVQTVLLIDWPSPDVPDTLVAGGFQVFVKGGPGPRHFSSRMAGPAGEMVVSPVAPPTRVDLVYCHRPLDELPGIVGMARELGATALWYQSGMAEDGARDPKASWLSGEDRVRVRDLVKNTGLACIDDVYIADAVRELKEQR